MFASDIEGIFSIFPLTVIFEIIEKFEITLPIFAFSSNFPIDKVLRIDDSANASSAISSMLSGKLILSKAQFANALFFIDFKVGLNVTFFNCEALNASSEIISVFLRLISVIFEFSKAFFPISLIVEARSMLLMLTSLNALSSIFEIVSSIFTCLISFICFS